MYLGKPGAGLSFNGLCVICPPDCDECFFGNKNFYNFTETNDFPIISEEEAHANNITLQCARCSIGFTLAFDLITCVKCIKHCNACFFLEPGSESRIIYEIYNYYGEMVDIKQNYTMNCTACIDGYALNFNFDCQSLCSTLDSSAECLENENLENKVCASGCASLQNYNLNVDPFPKECVPCESLAKGCSKCHFEEKIFICDSCYNGKINNFNQERFECESCSYCLEENCVFDPLKNKVKSGFRKNI